jgi:hypothetical protein
MSEVRRARNWIETRTQVTITSGSNLRFRNKGGRHDLIESPYQIRSCNTSLSISNPDFIAVLPHGRRSEVDENGITDLADTRRAGTSHEALLHKNPEIDGPWRQNHLVKEAIRRPA